jgi:Na+/proline symporter
MSGWAILGLIAAYFGLLMLAAYCVGRNGSGNAAFFLGNRQSPWYVVAIGMVGASLSGVTFVSVPGVVRDVDLTYMQMVLGFLPGYAFIAFVLLPLFYRWRVVSIYSYLEKSIGRRSYLTGTVFFLVSRTVLAAVRLFLAVHILQVFVLDSLGVPFVVTAVVVLGMMWAYTHRSGLKTIVWTDLLQTLCLVLALVLIIVHVARALHLGLGDVAAVVEGSDRFRIFVFDDWHTKQNFVKQFLSGCFVTIAMTGVDQEMMQKNLSCPTLRKAQKNMCLSGLIFVPVNFLFLCLGVLLLHYCSIHGLGLPAVSDHIFPDLIAAGHFGRAAVVFFFIGIVSVTFAGTDSALTGLTTSVCVDILGVGRYSASRARKIRLGVHFFISLAFIVIMLVFQWIRNTSIIDAIYTIVSYAYGPLLGLFACGILFGKKVNDRAAPFVCLLSPVACFGIQSFLWSVVGYRMGYELLILNALLVVIGMRCRGRSALARQKAD